MKSRALLLPAFVLFGFTVDAAHALDPAAACFVSRYKAAAKYGACVEAGVKIARKSIPDCTARYFDTFTKLQLKYPGTACDKPRFVDNLDGTVTDNLTGLVWEKKTNGDGVENLGDLHDADNLYTWTDADSDQTDEDGTVYTDFLTGLNAAGFAGANGWRLPTIEELLTITLVEPCPSDYCVDAIFGSMGLNDGESYYWSSSTHSDATTGARCVDFYQGLLENTLPKEDGRFVRAVRSAW
jgi:hypothetical protein